MAFVFKKKIEQRQDKSLFDFTSAENLVDKNTIESIKNKKSEYNPNEKENSSISGNQELENRDFFDDVEYPDEEFNSLDIEKDLSERTSDIEDIPQNLKDMLFPYKTVRPEQEKLIESANDAIKNKKHLIAHAPTGLGKTVSVLAPALNHAIRNNLRVLFLTSRHTQHLIAMKTANEIRDKYKINFIATDIIGKKWMCLNAAAKNANSQDFSEVCKYLRENNGCKHYINTRKSSGLTTKAQLVLDGIKNNINDSKRIIDVANENELCPYELSLELAKESKLIITDYYYAFNENIMDNFFKRSQMMLSDCILIVDEGHNLPQRIREQQTSKLSTIMINRAIKEAKNIADEDIEKNLFTIKNVLEEWAKELDDQMTIMNFQKDDIAESDKKYNPEKYKENAAKEKERRDSFEAEVLVRKEDFETDLKRKLDIKKVIEEFYESGKNIKDINNTASYIFVIGQFLDKWRNTYDESYARILKKDQKNITLSIRCLDPAVTSKSIIHESYSTIMMSGTLQPTTMYRDMLGFDEDRTIEKSFGNPFPKKNRLNIIIPKTTTKYEMRGIEQYKNIARICSEIINSVTGNSIIFFPSYDLLKKVFNEMNNAKKTIIMESPGLSREEKFAILEKFKSYHETGASLLGVQSGSFSEGIDLPGDYLKAVVVVGLPLQKPDLETRQLINYFDVKFQKGWDYGYVFPAFSKILQSAGRCIRSEKDKGIIAFVDERYSWPNYIRCFPSDWEMKIDLNYAESISEFFRRFD